MGQISLQIPQTGQPNATEDVKVANNFTTIQTAVNGNLDATNITPALAQSATVNQGGQTVKGFINNVGPGGRTNAAYGNLGDAADVVTVTLPANGLLQIWYQATWQETVAGAAKAAIFVGATQLQMALPGNITPVPYDSEASIGGSAGNNWVALSSIPTGLGSLQAGTYVSSYTGDAGVQVVGGGFQTLIAVAGGGYLSQAGPVYATAPAGSCAVSVQFKASSGTVTAQNRRLWVQAISFA